MEGVYIMAMNNDSRIIELKKQVEDKKKRLTEIKIKFMPETNCILELDGDTYNLNVLSEDMLVTLMIRLNMYVLSANDLKIEVPPICGYSVDSWILDIKNKMFVNNIKREEAELKTLESKLTKMLSDDKKTELELDSIAALLD